MTDDDKRAIMTACHQVTVGRVLSAHAEIAGEMGDTDTLQILNEAARKLSAVYQAATRVEPDTVQ